MDAAAAAETRRVNQRKKVSRSATALDAAHASEASARCRKCLAAKALYVEEDA